MTEKSAFHQSVAARIRQSEELGFDDAFYDKLDVDTILKGAMAYLAEGHTVRAGSMIVAARAYIQRHSKNPMQVAVEEFMRRCDQEVKEYPDLPTEEIVTLRIRLMVEELLGAIDPEAINEDLSAERYVYLLIHNKSDELIKSMLKGDLVGVADGLADVLYVVFGTAAAYGIDIQEVFDEVHRSNLSKTVWDEERQRWYIEKDEFGKGIKPDAYSPADIPPIIDRQIKNYEARQEFLNDQSDRAELILGDIRA